MSKKNSRQNSSIQKKAQSRDVLKVLLEMTYDERLNMLAPEKIITKESGFEEKVITDHLL